MAVRASQRDPLVLNVAQGTTNGALHHEATNAAGLVAADDGVLHCVHDGVDHGVHGRYVGVRHVSLPWVNSGENSGKNSGESLLPSSFLQELDDFSWSLFYSQRESFCSQGTDGLALGVESESV